MSKLCNINNLDFIVFCSECSHFYTSIVNIRFMKNNSQRRVYKLSKLQKCDDDDVN